MPPLPITNPQAVYKHNDCMHFFVVNGGPGTHIHANARRLWLRNAGKTRKFRKRKEGKLCSPRYHLTLERARHTSSPQL